MNTQDNTSDNLIVRKEGLTEFYFGLQPITEVLQ